VTDARICMVYSPRIDFAGIEDTPVIEEHHNIEDKIVDNITPNLTARASKKCRIASKNCHLKKGHGMWRSHIL